MVLNQVRENDKAGTQLERRGLYPFFIKYTIICVELNFPKHTFPEPGTRLTQTIGHLK